MTAEKTCHDETEIDAKRAAYLQDVATYAPSKLTAFKRAYAGSSLRAAINAQCLDCMQCDVAAIRTCTAPCCPLFEVRPYQKSDRNSSEV